jgi:hypothetical protein
MIFSLLAASCCRCAEIHLSRLLRFPQPPYTRRQRRHELQQLCACQFAAKQNRPVSPGAMRLKQVSGQIDILPGIAALEGDGVEKADVQ